MSCELTFLIPEELSFHDHICAMKIDCADIRKELNKNKPKAFIAEERFEASNSN